MKIRVSVAGVALCFLCQSAWALSMLEFLKLNGVEQYKLAKPMLISFLGAGYKKVPDNEFTLIDEMKKLAFEKGYVYQNAEEVAKEAAIKLGMVRGF